MGNLFCPPQHTSVAPTYSNDSVTFLSKAEQEEIVGDDISIDAPEEKEEWRASNNCAICDAKFSPGLHHEQVSKGSKKKEHYYKATGSEESGVVLFYINNTGPTEMKKSWTQEGGDGSGGCVTEVTHTCRKTVVAAYICPGTDKDRKNQLILPGLRCPSCLHTMDGILMESDRVAIRNTIKNTLSSGELAFQDNFSPSEVKFGLMSQDGKYYLAYRTETSTFEFNKHPLGDEIWTMGSGYSGECMSRIQRPLKEKDVDFIKELPDMAEKSIDIKDWAWFLSVGVGKKPKNPMLSVDLSESKTPSLEQQWTMEVVKEVERSTRKASSKNIGTSKKKSEPEEALESKNIGEPQESKKDGEPNETTESKKVAEPTMNERAKDKAPEKVENLKQSEQTQAAEKPKEIEPEPSVRSEQPKPTTEPKIEEINKIARANLAVLSKNGAAKRYLPFYVHLKCSTGITGGKYEGDGEGYYLAYDARSLKGKKPFVKTNARYPSLYASAASEEVGQGKSTKWIVVLSVG